MAASGERGRLRIGVYALIPGSFLAELIERYQADHPGIEVDITEGSARDAVMQLRADHLDVVFVTGTPELPDCHARCIWTEPLLATLPERHPLARQPAVTGVDLADETFLVHHGGTGPQVHDHIVARLAGRWSAPSILRFDVQRGTLLSMVGQGFGITVRGAATSLLQTSGVAFCHRRQTVKPYAWEDAATLLADFWQAVDMVLKERGIL